MTSLPEICLGQASLRECLCDPPPQETNNTVHHCLYRHILDNIFSQNTSSCVYWKAFNQIIATVARRAKRHDGNLAMKSQLCHKGCIYHTRLYMMIHTASIGCSYHKVQLAGQSNPPADVSSCERRQNDTTTATATATTPLPDFPSSGADPGFEAWCAPVFVSTENQSTSLPVDNPVYSQESRHAVDSNQVLKRPRDNSANDILQRRQRAAIEAKKQRW